MYQKHGPSPKFLVFERSILRCFFFGPIKEGNVWQIKKDMELASLHGDIDLVKFGNTPMGYSCGKNRQQKYL